MELFDKLKASLATRVCPVCGAKSVKKILVDQRIDWQKLDEFAFASRKDPELMSWRMVCCAGCDVAYAAEAPSGSELVDAYHEADYDSSEEANYAAESYARELAPHVRRLPQRKAAMEIGAGNGAFLTSLVKMGFENVIGFEPSTAAIALAPREVRPLLREGIMEADKIEEASFDFICCFQTLEHVRDPLQISRDVHRLLRDGGMVAFITHNYRGTLNRILGQRSPIIDIEHLQLFSPPSIHALLYNAGFCDIVVKSFWNRYPLRYWMRLLPLSAARKRSVITMLESVGLAGISVTANVGNMVSIGYKRSTK